MELSDRISLIQAALGQTPLDLLIRNVRVVNTYTGEITPTALGVKNGRVASAQAEGLEATEVVDGGGLLAVPGLIDTHVHLDSTLLTPEQLAGLIVPHGTTVMLADPMEISNVAGQAGLQALLAGSDRLPYHVYVEVSSRVPTAPGLETTGGELGLAEVRQILAWPNAVSLGELDPSKVLGLLPEYLEKVAAAQAAGKICNGHAAGLSGRELEAYVCGGLADDHECVDYEDARLRLSAGLAVLVREGSAERNLEPILRGALREGADTGFLMFCTDDKHPDDILAEGHIDWMVRRAIALGVDPLDALRMATLNAARHFRIDHLHGSLAPGRFADILLVEDLREMLPHRVYVRGRLVAEDGRLVGQQPAPLRPDWLRHTVKITRGRVASDFRLPARGASATVKVIELIPGQIINRAGSAVLPVRDGAVQPDLAQDVLKLAVIERYGKNGNIGLSFVRGFGLKRGAIASSVSHDHHNIVAAGTNDEDLAACVRAIEAEQGGLALSEDGAPVKVLPLPVGGLLSELPAGEVIAALNELTAAFRARGGTLPAPMMALSFISLPTVPELGLTDRGLVDVAAHRLISPFIDA